MKNPSKEDLAKLIAEQGEMLRQLHTLAQDQSKLLLTSQDALKRKDEIIAVQQEQIGILKEKNSVLEFNHEKLKTELARLKKWVHGSKTEKFVSTNTSSSQHGLGIDAEVVNACSITNAKRITYVTTTSEKQISHPGRLKLPEGLRREVIIISPDGSITGLKKIGEEITEVLEYRPGELYVIRYVRPKYAKPNDSGVLVGKLPERALEKTIFGERLLTQIMVDKYVDHLPLHRQNERFKRYGINVPSSTMSDAVRNVCNLIAPLGVAHLQELLEALYIGVDETPVPVQDRDKKGVVHRGFYWVYYNVVKKLVYFDYREGRGREGPMEMLRDYIGYLQCDGYTVYENLEKKKAIKLLACMAHARRLFIEALDNDKATAEYVLGRMQLLYAIEDEIKDLSFEERKTVRQQKSVPILKHLGEWMKDKYMKAVSHENDINIDSSIGKALAYSVKRWENLSRYTEDGMLLIDNYLNFLIMRSNDQICS